MEIIMGHSGDGAANVGPVVSKSYALFLDRRGAHNEAVKLCTSAIWLVASAVLQQGPFAGQRALASIIAKKKKARAHTIPTAVLS